MGWKVRDIANILKSPLSTTTTTTITIFTVIHRDARTHHHLGHHAGTGECEVELSNESEIISPPLQVRSIGESVQLNCTVKDADLFTVSWSKKSRTNPAEIFMFTMASSLTIKDPRFSIYYDANTTTYSLSISQIEQTDTGIYECMIIMSLSEKVTSTVELLVRHPPTISDKMTTPSATVAEHQPASLTCNAEGYPRPTITWRRAKNGIMPAGGHIAAGNVLKIQATRREDRGTYICMASNDVGKPVQKSISLEVEFAPKISVPRPKVAQALDYDISLECTVEAHPAPSVTWMRNNETLYNGDDFKISHLASADGVTSSALTIEAIESEMFGDYWCHASNKMGKAEARVNVFGELGEYVVI